MVPSLDRPATSIAASAMVRRDTDVFEPFNGSNEMFFLRDSENDTARAGRHRVVISARTSTDSIWNMTVVVRMSGQQAN